MSLASPSPCGSPHPGRWQGRPPDPGTDLNEGAVPHSSPHCHVGEDRDVGNGALQPHTAGVDTATALREAGNTGHETGGVSRAFRLRPLPLTPPLPMADPKGPDLNPSLTHTLTPYSYMFKAYSLGQPPVDARDMDNMKSDPCSWKWGPIYDIPFPASSYTEPLFMPASSTWDTASYFSTQLGLYLLPILFLSPFGQGAPFSAFPIPQP